MKVCTTFVSLVFLASLASCSTALADEQEEPLVYQGPGSDKKADPPKATPPKTPPKTAPRPVPVEPVADEPVVDEPVADEPAADEPVADEPAPDEPAANGANDPKMEGTPRPLAERDEELWPCTDCHDDPEDFNMRVRKLRNAHETIEIKHGGSERWCYDCHNQENKDKLRFAGGKEVAFETSYMLCGQCHGEKLRDWYAGVHGKRVGFWNGEKTYSLCVNCHNPHQPKFKLLKPKPIPVRPSEIR